MCHSPNLNHPTFQEGKKKGVVCGALNKKKREKREEKEMGGDEEEGGIGEKNRKRSTAGITLGEKTGQN
jgi:hypothetical protein